MLLRRPPLLITLLAALAFLPFLGQVPLFDWDEINFAESAREMLASGEYGYVQINYQPFWEKPPLFIWMQALSMQVFGVNAWAARFPNALAGVVTLLILWTIGRRERGPGFAAYWVLAYGCSFLPHLYFKSGIIDPWFNLFILLGLYFGYRYWQSAPRLSHALWAGVFVGASLLTKGPVGPLIFGLSGLVFLAFNRRPWHALHLSALAVFGLAFALVGGFWFLLQIFTGRWEVIQDFIVYQIRLFQTEDAGHGGFPGYHAVVLLLGVFPASVFALPGLFRSSPQAPDALSLLMRITFWVVLLLFTLVQTKIMHYSSMCYFPLTFLAAERLWRGDLAQGDRLAAPWQWGLLLGIGLLLGGLVTALVFAPEIQAALREAAWLDDPFAKGNLQADAGWQRYEWLPGLLLIGASLYAFAHRHQQPRRAYGVLFLGAGLFINLSLLWVVPRIERISQHAAIAFFQEKSQEEAYYTTLFYKSYAPYFYGRVQPYAHPRAAEQPWLLEGNIDRPVYLAAKVQHRTRVEATYPELAFLYEKNGFVFYRRSPN